MIYTLKRQQSHLRLIPYWILFCPSQTANPTPSELMKAHLVMQQSGCHAPCCVAAVFWDQWGNTWPIPVPRGTREGSAMSQLVETGAYTIRHMHRCVLDGHLVSTEAHKSHKYSPPSMHMHLFKLAQRTHIIRSNHGLSLSTFSPALQSSALYSVIS